jgi:hypothetical protein
MTMQAPLATAVARPASGPGRAVELDLGPHTVVTDEPGGPGGPAPLDLLTGSLAAATAMTARTHLERDGDPGDVEVVVTLDPGPPPVLYRRVLLGFRLGPADARTLADVLDRIEVAIMLRPAFTIRTQVEHAGELLN